MEQKPCNQVLLPWPPKVLSPNARGHWAARSKAPKDYRYRCCMHAKLAGLASVPGSVGRMLLVLEFMPPNRQRRDDDNLIAAFKSGRDGLADALGIDDRLFVTVSRLTDEVVKRGAVRVTLQPFEERVE